jgi:23S rRNA pseudouridine955/2504/2580 synthase
MRELTVRTNDAGQRLDKFLAKSLKSMPPSLMYKLIRTKKIKVNRHRAEPKQMLELGDTLQLFISEEFFSDNGAEQSLGKINTKLSVVFEDENIILLNKRPGVLVHEDDEGQSNTLALHLRAYLFQKGEYDPNGEQSFSPALCNRIDRNTGGIVIAAKNAAALRDMNERIRQGQVRKFYLCAVHGIPKHRQDTLNGWLLKNERTKTVRVYDENEPHPKDAKDVALKYKVISDNGRDSLVEVELLTGRTHQIRAQMSHIGHALLGDGKYGVNREDRERGYVHQALYSYKVRFDFGDEGYLSYLNGREFQLSKSEIWFIKDFL